MKAERSQVVDVLRDVFPEIQAFVESKLVRQTNGSAHSIPTGNGDIALPTQIVSTA